MYVSVNFHAIDDCFILKNDQHYRVAAILMRKINNRLPFWAQYDLYGNWIIVDTQPQLILTEKTSALIKLFEERSGCGDILPFIRDYNITKFVYLKNIVEQYLITDLLRIIVNLLD